MSCAPRTSPWSWIRRIPQNTGQMQALCLLAAPRGQGPSIHMYITLGCRVGNHDPANEATCPGLPGWEAQSWNLAPAVGLPKSHIPGQDWMTRSLRETVVGDGHPRILVGLDKDVSVINQGPSTIGIQPPTHQSCSAFHPSIIHLSFISHPSIFHPSFVIFHPPISIC